MSEYQASQKQGSLTGVPEKPNGTRPNADYIRSIDRQNEAAQMLSEHGFNVEQLPSSNKSKSPDLRINGDLADVASPVTDSPKSIWKTVDYKVNKQGAPNVVLNLADSTLTPTNVAQYILNNPVKGLSRLVIIKDGKVIVLGGK